MFISIIVIRLGRRLISLGISAEKYRQREGTRKLHDNNRQFYSKDFHRSFLVGGKISEGNLEEKQNLLSIKLSSSVSTDSSEIILLLQQRKLADNLAVRSRSSSCITEYHQQP